MDLGDPYSEAVLSRASLKKAGCGERIRGGIRKSRSRPVVRPDDRLDTMALRLSLSADAPRPNELNRIIPREKCQVKGV